MVMGKKVWAVVCGAVRQEFELYATLAMLCDYRSKGLLEGIVISTWKGELDNIPDLRQKLKVLDIYVTELDMPDDDINKYEFIGYVRQAYQLKMGLDYIPDDVFVLKCRTDYSENKIKVFDSFLRGDIDFTVGSHGAFRVPLHYRIGVTPRFCVTIPFGLSDPGFFGYKDDLYKMCNFEMTSLRYGMQRLRADLAFFVNIFINDYPIIGEYLTAVKNYFDGERLFTGLKTYIQADEARRASLVLPEIMNKFFALYFVLLNTCFINAYSVDEEIEPFNIMDCFTGNAELGVGGVAFCTTQFRNTRILRMIIQNECIPTECYRKIYKHILGLFESGYAENMHFTDEDYNEMCLYVKDVLQLNPKKVVYRKRITEIRKNNTDFTGAIDFLFSDYLPKNEEKSEFYNIIHNLCFDKSSNFYDSVVNNLQNIEQLDASLYESALAPATRTERPDILKLVATKLYNNQISTERVSSAEFLFNRWAEDKVRFYKFPMHPDKIAAFYRYGKYAEPLGNDKLPVTFYNILLNKFEIEADAPDSYADGVLDAVKEIVRANYLHYKDNLTVQYMIDFLADEFGRDAFTEEQWDYLSKYIIERKYSLPFKRGDKDAYCKLLDSADEAEGEELAVISRLLLRETVNQPKELQDKADKILLSVPMTIFTAAYFDKQELDLSEIKSDDDFVLLCRIMSYKRRLRDYYAELLGLCEGNSYRRLALELLLQLEGNEKVHMFSTKNGSELWLGYSDFSALPINEDFIIPNNKNGLKWPYGESASDSPYAAFLRMKGDNVFISIEFNSCKCAAKDRLFSKLEVASFKQFNPDTGLIKIQQKKYPATSPDDISSGCEQALKLFCKYGAMLSTNTAPGNE